VSSQHLKEIQKRRTFGIISHPDAGKTTLTEKLLLFGGAIQMAGAVKSRKTAVHATSDWMAIEKERGISVTTSVMKFNYRDYEINLLDTPGHQDFSEDTYRVLTAVDSALMVIDSAKGVETQTTKLMEVCRMRNTPIITFINKLDREGMEPLDILADIEDKLQIECVPLSWPIGMGKGFKGVYDLHRKQITLFTPSQDTRPEDSIVVKDLSDPVLDSLIGKFAAEKLREDIDLLQGAANPFRLRSISQRRPDPGLFRQRHQQLRGARTARRLCRTLPRPRPPRHRHPHGRPGRRGLQRLHLQNPGEHGPGPPRPDRLFPHLLRQVHPGDEGHAPPAGQGSQPEQRHRVHGPGALACRRGLSRRHHRHPQPRHHQDRRHLQRQGRTQVHRHSQFRPEHFRRVVLRNPLKMKQLQKGLLQMAEEGAVQVFRPIVGNDYILGAVGVLQFEVTMTRLKDEYGVDATYEPLSYTLARWVSSDNKQQLREFEKKFQFNLALDAEGHLSYLAEGSWRLGPHPGTFSRGGVPQDPGIGVTGGFAAMVRFEPQTMRCTCCLFDREKSFLNYREDLSLRSR
jgi:peptide chain release factor 3